ncbi:hypothetical protein JKP88DRAFT_248777 [Tribonema minus]|uniref:Uncharacterized protein n=1 Tax=Tribonema minus TaxID=303371 RepID=A0A836C910_9STRA|nr:hypothetical protein JKP88DRAFT_248777 [Tribonema minus]
MSCVLNCRDEFAATWGFLGAGDKANGRCINETRCECDPGFYTYNTYGQAACVNRTYTDVVLVLALHLTYLVRHKRWPHYHSRSAKLRKRISLLFVGFSVCEIIPLAAYFSTGTGMDKTAPAVMLAQGMGTIVASAVPVITANTPVGCSVCSIVAVCASRLQTLLAANTKSLAVASGNAQLEAGTLRLTKAGAGLSIADHIKLRKRLRMMELVCWNLVVSMATLPIIFFVEPIRTWLDERPILQFQPQLLIGGMWQLLITTLIVQPALLSSGTVAPTTPSGSTGALRAASSQSSRTP